MKALGRNGSYAIREPRDARKVGEKKAADVFRQVLYH